MNFIDDVDFEVSMRHPRRDDWGLLDRDMGLRRCLDGTNRRRHRPWGGDKLKSCPGSSWRLSLWEYLRAGRKIQIQKSPLSPEVSGFTYC